MTLGISDINAALFFVGCISFIIGALFNLRFWLSGTDSLGITLSNAVKAVFSGKIVSIFKGAVIYLLGKKRLSRSGRTRGFEKSIFIIFYAIIILVNHYYVDIVGESANLLDVIKNFFYSPFVPAYIFNVENWQNLGWIKTFFFIDNLSMVMIVCFAEAMLIIRRFHEKYYTINSTYDRILIFLPITWLVLRMFAESASMLYFNVPSQYNSYLFVGYILTFILNPLSQIFGIQALYSLFWLASGVAFMALVAVWPYTKMWHAIAGTLTILINSPEIEQ